MLSGELLQALGGVAAVLSGALLVEPMLNRLAATDALTQIYDAARALADRAAMQTRTLDMTPPVEEGPRPVNDLSPDGLWTAKDRSGRLDAWEPADLGIVIRKIAGGAA